MIYYKVCYYNGDKKVGGQYLKESQLKEVKEFADIYLEIYKKINISMEVHYEPDPIKDNLKIQSIEVR